MKTKRKSVLIKKIIVTILIFIMTGCRRAVDRAIPYSGELQSVLNHSSTSIGLKGVSATIIVPGFEPWKGVSGQSYDDQPITESTLFDMGSAGKIILGPLMVKLAEEDLLGLDDPIREYLPDFPYADGAITIRQLLNHTSGLYMMVKHPDSPFRKSFDDIDHDNWWTVDEIFSKLGGEPYFPPGEGWCYTQAGYQITSLIVEKVTGQTLSEAVQSYVMDPLGIDGMLLDFCSPIPEDVEVAHPWVDINQDGLYEDVHAYSRNWIASLSRILFYANSSDLATWGHALFTDDILSDQSRDKILDFYHMDDWCGEPPLFTGYGLGVQEFDTSLTRGQTAWGHLGSIQGYRTILAHLPDSKATIAVMTNTDTDDAFAVFDALLEVLVRNIAIGEAEEVMASFEVLPEISPPPDASIVDTFQKERLFCDHQSTWEIKAGTDDWLNVSLDWVVGTDRTKAENAWDYHTHTITINGVEIKDVEQFTHDAEHYTVICPQETLEIWAKGLSIYLPPLPKGEYKIRWHSEINGQFDNGWVSYKRGNYLDIHANVVVD